MKNFHSLLLKAIANTVIVQCEWDRAPDMHFIVFCALNHSLSYFCKSQQKPWQKVLGWEVKRLQTGKVCHNRKYPNPFHMGSSCTAQVALVSDGKSCQLLRRVNLLFLLKTLKTRMRLFHFPEWNLPLVITVDPMRCLGTEELWEVLNVSILCFNVEMWYCLSDFLHLRIMYKQL